MDANNNSKPMHRKKKTQTLYSHEPRLQPEANVMSILKKKKIRKNLRVLRNY